VNAARRWRAVRATGQEENGIDPLMTFKLTRTKPTKTVSKTLAVTAVIATAIMLSQTAAEARRYKHKTVRHHVAATTVAPSSGGIFGAGNQYAHLARAAAPSRTGHASRGARHWRNARTAAPQVARLASPRASQAARQSYAAVSPMAGMGAGIGSSGLVAQARRYLGSNPTGMSAAWCARFMNMVLEKSGRRGTGSNMARSFAGYGRRVAGPQVGAIAVMARGRGGGHVGIVSGIDKSGNPVIISGNHNRRVGEAVYPRGRIYAYVMP
jgi:uncharacterized protein (TIGR02594 family)